MAHPIPKELRGEERWFTIPYLNIYLNKKGVIYNGAASGIAVLIGKITNLWIFAILFLVLNIIAYPLAHMRVSKNKFEGGNVPYDIHFYRKIRWKKFRRNVYIRRIRP